MNDMKKKSKKIVIYPVKCERCGDILYINKKDGRINRDYMKASKRK